MRIRRQIRASRGYLLTECLVYISLVVVVLAAGYVAMYRCIDNALVLRRNADDITAALDAGERWRADVRQAHGACHIESSSEGDLLLMPGSRGEIAYRFGENAVTRRVGQGLWIPVLGNVESSVMHLERRPNVTAWRWELELRPRARGTVKPSGIRPLFSFLAASPSEVTE